MLIAYRLLFLCNLLLISGFNLLYNIAISGGIEPPLDTFAYAEVVSCIMLQALAQSPDILHHPYLICASDVHVAVLLAMSRRRRRSYIF